MLKIIGLFLAATAMPVPQAQHSVKQTPIPAQQPIECKGKTYATAEEAMQSGCCSWHNGVCGCYNGRKTCCDGTTSPSCGC